MLVLEDVHWADQATLDVLRVLGRRIDTTRALALATYRDDEVERDHPLRIVLGELASAAGVTRLSVPRLSLDAVRALAEPLGADADAIHRLTHGNAFYVTEILAAPDAALPRRCATRCSRGRRSSSRPARRLLDVVSVVPARVELRLLEAVAPDELEQLDECLGSGVLRADGDGVAFRHELARLAVESALPPHRRQALNAAIVRALEGSGDVSRLAHHAEGAGRLRRRARVRPGRRAAGSGRASAPGGRGPVRPCAAACGHAWRQRSAQRLLAAYGKEAEVTGQYDESIDARLEAIELYRELGDTLEEASVMSRLTIPYLRAGRNAEAEDASRTAIGLLEALPPGRELASAYADQAYARMLNRDNADGVAWGEKAVAAAESLGDDDTLAYGLNMVGTSFVMAGEIERGVASAAAKPRDRPGGGPRGSSGVGARHARLGPRRDVRARARRALPAASASPLEMRTR